MNTFIIAMLIATVISMIKIRQLKHDQLRKHMKLMQFNWKNQLFTMEYRKEFELKHGKRRWKKVKENGKTYYQMLKHDNTN